MQSELMQPGEELWWKHALPFVQKNRGLGHLLLSAFGMPLVWSIILGGKDRLMAALDGDLGQAFILLLLPLTVLGVHLTPWLRANVLPKVLLVTLACFAILVTGVFATTDPLALVLLNLLSMWFGWLLSYTRPIGPPEELHLTNRGAHWVFPGARPRFAPWDAVSVRLDDGRFTLIGYPGETKEFTLSLKLVTEQRADLIEVLRRTGQPAT